MYLTSITYLKQEMIVSILVRLRKIALNATILVAVAVASTGNASAQDLYLIIGQSNAAGRDVNINSNRADSESRNVKLFTDGNTFINASQPLNQFSGVLNPNRDQGVNFGLEFGKDMFADNGRTVYLVVNARGGTNVASWRKGRSSGYFENSVQRVKDAESACGCRLKGILWHQGESNVRSRTGSFTRSYFSTLKALIEEYRDELREVPFLAGQLFQKAANTSFNNELKTLDDGDFLDDVDWVTSKNLTTFDGTHFDAASTRELGSRYAKIMRQFVN